MSGDVTLDPSCIYGQTLRIRASNTTLDCAGAVLRPDEGYALNVSGDIADITVRNCYVEGGNGISVRPPNRDAGESDDALRSRAPRRVVLTNLHVSGSENVGVYLHQYTAQVVLRRSLIVNNSSAGVYLAPHGMGHVLQDNRIADNGHAKPDGQPRLGWYRREGVAVDGSSHHVIEDNDIVGNALGGVLLYKNCQEHADENPDSLPRTMHASDNLLRGNRFAAQPFGVWIASRQSRDLDQMGCGDPTPYDNPLWTAQVYHPTYRDYASAYTTFELPFVSVWPDFAEDNTVTGNVFEEISLGGVRVEDDRARVEDNLFIGDFDYVFVGAPFRARLAGHPVTDTLILDNSWSHSIATAFEESLALIPEEHVGTVLDGNRRACADGEGGWLRHGAHTAASANGGAWTCDDGTLRPVAADGPTGDPGSDPTEDVADDQDDGPDHGADTGGGRDADETPGGAGPLHPDGGAPSDDTSNEPDLAHGGAGVDAGPAPSTPQGMVSASCASAAAGIPPWASLLLVRLLLRRRPREQRA